MYQKIIEEIKQNSEPKFAEWLRPFLSIKKDSSEILLGVRVPILRKLAKKYKNIEIDNLKQLLTSDIHESRSLAVFIMILKAKKEASETAKTKTKLIVTEAATSENLVQNATKFRKNAVLEKDVLNLNDF